MIRILASELARYFWREIRGSLPFRRARLAVHALRGGPIIQNIHGATLHYHGGVTYLQHPLLMDECSSLIIEGGKFHWTGQ